MVRGGLPIDNIERLDGQSNENPLEDRYMDRDRGISDTELFVASETARSGVEPSAELRQMAGINGYVFVDADEYESLVSSKREYRDLRIIFSHVRGQSDYARELYRSFREIWPDLNPREQWLVDHDNLSLDVALDEYVRKFLECYTGNPTVRDRIVAESQEEDSILNKLRRTISGPSVSGLTPDRQVDMHAMLAVYEDQTGSRVRVTSTGVRQPTEISAGNENEVEQVEIPYITTKEAMNYLKGEVKLYSTEMENREIFASNINITYNWLKNRGWKEPKNVYKFFYKMTPGWTLTGKERKEIATKLQTLVSRQDELSDYDG